MRVGNPNPRSWFIIQDEDDLEQGELIEPQNKVLVS